MKKESVLSVLKDIRELLKPKTFIVSSHLPKNERFVKNSDNIVQDNTTGLMWAPTLPKELTWGEAKKACADLTLGGFKDWRLPTVNELFSLVDRTKYDPAIDKDFFPDTKSAWYWTVEEVAGNSGYAWIVGFGNGHVDDISKDYTNYVRPVRSSQ